MWRLEQDADFVAGVDKLIERLDAGEFDLVGVGRALLSDYAWARKVKDGRFEDLEDFNAEALKELA